MFDDPEVKAFKRDFPTFVPAAYRKLALGGKKNLLQVSVWIYHRDWRRDADAEAVYDSLQSAGVVSNDRWIRVKHIYATEVDPKNPRVEIEISELSR